MIARRTGSAVLAVILLASGMLLLGFASDETGAAWTDSTSMTVEIRSGVWRILP